MAERINVAISKTAHDKLKILVENEPRQAWERDRTLGGELEFLIGRRYEELKQEEIGEKVKVD